MAVCQCPLPFPWRARALRIEETEPPCRCRTRCCCRTRSPSSPPARSIGRGIAEFFLDEGASVVVSGRYADKGAAALAEMGAGDRAMFVAGDVRAQADVEALVDFADERFGGSTSW